MFSGCGGMDLGFVGDFTFLDRHYERQPFKVLWANDISPAACRTYRRNLDDVIIQGDVWNAVASMPARPDVLVGGFPCQDVSVNGKMVGLRGKRTSLYLAMVEAIERVKPRIFVAENVKGLLMRNQQPALRRLLADFGGLGYRVSYQLYFAADYGVPQRRERVFIVGTAPDVPTFLPPPPERTRSTWITAKEAIGSLEDCAECEAFNHVWSRAGRSPEQGNRRLRADQPGHTIRAECHGNIQYHYRLRRRISMREAARIQSFPDNFIFDCKLRETERQVGNAVPPVLAWHIASAVHDCLDVSRRSVNDRIRWTPG